MTKKENKTKNEDVQKDTLNQTEESENETDNVNEESNSEQPVEENEKAEESLTKSLTDALNEEKEKYMRLYADFDNFRKRTLKEKTEISIYSQSELLKKILPVLDNLERAALSETTDDQYKEGVNLVTKQFCEVLKSEGLNEITALNEKFDPNKHYAVATDSLEDKDNDIITEVLQKGYAYKEKIIRPAMVKVNKK